MANLLGGMGGGGRQYVLKIIADVKDAVKGVDDVAAKTSSMKDKMIGVGKAVATGLAAAAVVKFGEDCLSAAADADDAADAMESAFGGASSVIDDFSKNTAEKMGLSSQDYQTMAAKTGRILTGFGVSNTDAANQTNTLATRAADMAAIVGGTTEEAMDAIGKAMQGQTKGLKQYQISISAAEVEARAMAEGYVDASGKVTDAGKAIATQELILERTAKYQGEFAKNSGDLGSQQDILKAKFEDLQTKIGTALIPVIMELFKVIQPLMDFLSQNVGWLAPLAAGILAIVAAVKIWNVVQLILNSTLLANPIFLVIAAIAALVAGLIWAYNNVGWFRDAVDAMASGVVAAFTWIKDAVVGVFNWVSENWPLLIAILTGPIGVAVLMIVNNWDTIKNAVMGVYNWIVENWPLLLAILAGPFGLAVKVILDNWDAIRKFFVELPGNIVRWLGNIAGIIAGPFKSAAQASTDGFRSVTDFFYRLPGQIGGYLSNLYNIITYPFRTAFGWISGATQGVTDWFYRFPGFLNSAWSGLARVIQYPFEQAFRFIKWLWNSTVGGFHFDIPSWVPFVGGKTFGIPQMATGGIVNRPTLAVIGEAGPEAVIPLDRLASGGDVTYIVNVYALNANAETGRLVAESLREYNRTTGRAAAL